MKELLKKEKVRALINKAKEDKITYEEINEELKLSYWKNRKTYTYNNRNWWKNCK